MIQWLQGKKTYIGGAVLALPAIYLFMTGKMEAPQLLMVLGAALMVAGLGAKLQRFLPGIVQMLQDLKNKNANALVTDGAQLATAELLQPATSVAPSPSVVVNVHPAPQPVSAAVTHTPPSGNQG
jgi:hypothetical protein